TVNVRIRFLKAFFNALYRENVIDKDPMKHIKLMKTDEKPIEILTEAELYRLLMQPDKRLYSQFRDLVLMYTLLDTGLRIKEAVNLKTKDIDFKTRAIIVPAEISKNRRVRVLPLSNKTVKLLLELVTENKETFPEAEHVFLTQSGTPYNENSFRRRLLMYKEKAGITKPVHPHLFRKMFAIEFLNSGGNLFFAYRLLGHQDYITTRRYYHANIDDIKNQHALHSPVVKLRKKFRNQADEGNPSRSADQATEILQSISSGKRKRPTPQRPDAHLIPTISIVPRKTRMCKGSGVFF